MKKVSVIFSTLNRKNDLKSCLDSLRQQTLKPSEIIVVDGHSTDGTIDLIKKNYPEIKLIIMPNSSYGPCEKFNIGMASAKNEYLALLDDDVILPKNWINSVMKKFSKEPKNTAVITTSYKEPDMPENFINKGEDFYTNAFHGCCSIVKKSIVESAGYFSKEFFIYVNEADLSAKILNLGYRIKWCPKIIAYHKKPFGARMSKDSYYYHIRNYLWFSWKYYKLKDIIVKNPINLSKKFIDAIKHGHVSIFFKACFDAFSNIRYALKNRQICNKKDFVAY